VDTSPTYRAREVNFGDRTKLRGPERKTLCWMNVEDSAPHTVYASARLTGPEAQVRRAAARVHLAWGHGGASVEATFPIVRRLRVPLAASMIRLEGSLVDVTTGAPPSRDVEAEISAFVAVGTDGESLPNTRALLQSGAEGVLAEASERVLSVHGFNVGPSDVFCMLFDASELPLDGASPRLVVPAPRTAPFSLRLASPRDFVGGVTWAASSDPFTLAHDAGARLLVDVEMML
jgi:hypothetical protein